MPAAQRIDVVSIFPDYLTPLELSLIGRARRDGLIQVHVHDLRDFAHDRHRTVDDTPYGGGAGMVMRPEPWGEALQHVLAQAAVAGAAKPHLIVPGPGGEPFSQAMARRLAAEPWLAFACGRYEGIDERVYDHAREDLGLDVSVVSLGDYVLGGGEVAALVLIEAITRLIPGVIGNADSLVEESHEGGLLEYPIYTKPRVWEGRAVPEVLLSGNHAEIAAWRHEQALARTAGRRPDLLHRSQVTVAGGVDVEIRRAAPADVPELFTLTRACWVSEAHANETLAIPPLLESLDDARASLATTNTWVAHSAGRLVGSVRTEDRGDTLYIGRLMVAPDLQGRGLGRRLLDLAERSAPGRTRAFQLTVGARSRDNLRMYRKAGYRPDPRGPVWPGTVELVKPRRE